jgi:MFS transporter, OFA family, oxalate/formate antiporter
MGPSLTHRGQLPNRWVIAAAAVVMQVCLGSVYSWSVFVKPLTALEPWTLTQVSINFTIAMGFLGLGSVIGGTWQDRSGPRTVTTFAGILYGCGFLVAALAVSAHSRFGMYGGYGVMCGLGMGMGYVCPVATISKWFPDRRGLMTGLAVMGFGAGALVMSPIAARMIIAWGVVTTLATFGTVYMIVIIAASQFLSIPPQGWKPEGWEPTAADLKRTSTVDYTVGEATRTLRFYLTCLLFWLNTSAGIMVISQASPMAQDVTGVSAVEAATIVVMVSICNALGRIIWAWVSDHLGRAEVFFVLFAIQIGLFFALPHLHAVVWFTTVLCSIALCYGGGFGVTPSLVSDFFGARYLGGIYGWVLLAWGTAAIPSPLLIAHVRQTTGTYQYATNVIGCAMIAALIVPVVTRRIARNFKK